jgi:hypothetical protein
MEEENKHPKPCMDVSPKHVMDNIHPSIAFYPFQWWRTCHVINCIRGFSHY